MSILCGVCTTAPSKYKCPTCSVPYCSLSCFKSHKQDHNDREPKDDPETKLVSRSASSDSKEPLPDVSKTTEDIATALKDSPSFHNLLKKHPSLRGELQHLCEMISESSEKRTSYSLASKDSRFGAQANRGRSGRGEAQALRKFHFLRENPNSAHKEAINEFLSLIDSLKGPKS